jgi:type VI secretion system protein ImpH
VTPPQAAPAHSEPLERLAQRPRSFHFYWAMRLLEAHGSELPRFGRAGSPRDESLRLGQEPSLAFKGAMIEHYGAGNGDPKPSLDINFFGLFGPEGPLPTTLTQRALDQETTSGARKDTSLRLFLNIFNHRLIQLFYRAWADAQPVCHADRPADDGFSQYIQRLTGVPSEEPDAQGPPLELDLFHAGWMLAPNRTARGLERMLAQYLETQVEVSPWSGRWMRLGPEDRTVLGEPWSALGRSAIGTRSWDAATHFELALGPMKLERFEELLPTGQALRHVAAIVRRSTGNLLGWRLRLRLLADQVPNVVLGQRTRLGWTSWLPARPEASGVRECELVPEMLLAESPTTMAGAA